MAKGPKKHLKRIRAPKSWLMNKLGGNFAVRPSQGPHCLKHSIPLQIFLRDKIKVAMNGREADTILHQKEGLVQIDKKIRRDTKYPIGLMDVIDIPKMGTAWRCLFDVKGRFTFVKIKKQESNFKLCRVLRKEMGANQIAYLVTHDGRTIRFADPTISMHDSIKYDLEKKTITEIYKFEKGNLAYISDGNNKGRVGTITHISKLDGNHDIVTLKDANNHIFTTRIGYVFIIGKGDKPVITLPKQNGLALSILEEAEKRQASE